jgi:hypothetical protein
MATTQWYVDFCATISPDTLATLAVYAAAMHPLYLGIEADATSLALLQRCLRPFAVPLPYIRIALTLLREGMRHTLGAPRIAPLSDDEADARSLAFMRAYHAFVALRFQRRMREQPALLSATVRVLVQGPFFAARMAHKSIDGCRRLPFFTGHTFFDLLIRADLHVLPSRFAQRYPDFMRALHDARDARADDLEPAPTNHRLKLQAHAPALIEHDIDATVQYSLLLLHPPFAKPDEEEERDEGRDFYEPYGLILRTELADSLCALRHACQ